MKYDFTKVPNREGMDAMAVDLPEFLREMAKDSLQPRIPMWVADMNFATSPAITEAIIRRTEHPLFGYYSPRSEYYDAIIGWQERRHGWRGVTPEQIGYENGVLGGVVSALRILCSQGDSVLVHSPTYVGFTHVLEDNGYHMVHSPLRKDAEGLYRMDFEDMEIKFRDQHIHTLLFCSPHNPTGRVWERAELEQLTALCEKYDVYIICDEIWSDLILPGFTHLPLQTVNETARERTISFYAPSKTFNLAGLIGSYHIISNPRLRHRMEKESSLCHYNSMNVLSQYALIGAYRPESEEWLDQLLQVLDTNLRYGADFIRDRFSGVELTRPQGTYLLFPDCEGWLKDHGKTLDELLRAGYRAGVIWQDGRQFRGNTHIRMNLACPTAWVQEAFDRLDRLVFNADKG